MNKKNDSANKSRKNRKNRKKMSGSRKYVIFGALALIACILAYGGWRAWKYYTQKPPKIVGTSYEERFNDINKTQLKAAQELGIEPIKDRAEADSVKEKLVKISENEFYQIAKLDYSIPYLTKGGKALLDTIGVNFRDSLRAKNLSEYKLVVSSVLRTEDDVTRLRASGNKNAAKKSAHCYGTTFDIDYSKYKKNWKKSSMRKYQTVDKETLKAVLAEVLEDLKEQNLCYVKYEVNQPCFHITSRM